MNIRVPKEELELVLPTIMSHYFQDEPDHTAVPTPERRGLWARIRAALAWIAEAPKRRAVYEELSMLSDHELADIGLSRTDVPHIFDPAFAAERAATRGFANDAEIRSRAA
jgi:uncharacterized protein YjiS (DUF1127 family)